jgi:DNA-binding Lrp family transcriptional regulator
MKIFYFHTLLLTSNFLPRPLILILVFWKIFLLQIVNILDYYFTEVMEELEQNNKVKILVELQKNARASLSELSKKTGLSRQTVAKTISSMEKNKEIWGYTAIFDPKLFDKKPFILMGKVDLSVNADEFIKKVTDIKLVSQNEEKIGLKISMYVNGKSDFFSLFWAKDIIEAKKVMNFYKKGLQPNIKEIDILDVMSTFRYAGIANPKMVKEWNKLLL